MKTLPKNSNRAIEKSTGALHTMMQDVLMRARLHGATDAAVAVNHDSGFSVDVRMGDVETVAFSEDRGVGVTIYIGSRKGTASSSDTTPAALDAMVSAAYAIAKLSAADPCFGLPDKALLATNYVRLDLSHPWDLEPIQAIEMALACEATGLSIDKRITNSDGVHVSTYHSCHGFATTQGFEGIQESTRHSISCSLLAADGAGMQRDYDYTTAHDATHLLPLDELARRTVERATSRLSARPIKTQQAPVLFSSRVSSGLFGSLIGAISGNNLYRKNSFLLDSLGQKIFPEFIRVYEQPHLLDGLGSAPFDGEGVLTRPNVLVDQGRLCQYVLSSYSARKLGLATTANCGGVFNLTIDPTAGDLTTLLEMMDTGLLVTELMGQGVNGLTGDYSRGASGFWVSGGKIQYPVEGITIAGNLKDIFQRVLAVGRDINPNIATRCGSVLIESMTIAGE